ncbi:nitrite reductase (NADH) large subunit [Methylomagnum ishizawai]|uniref:Nitrite reductase (NADH) large subunit n=1 Tax=Methylomagnum ishizawai TaxID=1760988 RepID=A0A1Y6D308_9GAMM|nr:nitrite reductase large subunit NirB [Methylomagnum ishizawai]SMF97037.1 nitrite reductase (NADH) large subunit [Methylomagnum ishizawai]
MSKQKLILVGNGMAGMRTVEELLKRAPNRYDITVFGAEPHTNYNRILLSPVLTGEKRLQDIVIHDEAWYAERDITLHKGRPIAAIDRHKRRVRTADGLELGYDRLLLATGSLPFILPVPGKDLDGVIGFRDIGDVNRMLEACAQYSHAVVIGGGLLGLEAANGLRQRGMKVTVVHLLDTLMERQLDKPASDLLKAALEKSGLEFKLEAQTEALLGEEGRVKAVRFKDGAEIPADLVVMAVGIRPNVELAKAAGLHCERGILVDDGLKTFDPHIYAVGECVQHRGQLFGLVAPLFEQAKICAEHLAGSSAAAYESSATSTKLKVTGIDVFSAGEFQGGADTEELVFQDRGRGVYKKLVLRDNRIQGAVLYGDTADGAWYFQLMREGTDIAAIREQVLFGQAQVDAAGAAPVNRAAALPDGAEVCGCNGVCKKTIVDAIVGHKLSSLDEVRAQTKASASCGSCTGLVEQILQHTLGEAYAAGGAKKSLCKCTEHSHEEIRAAIRERNLKSIPELMRALAWKTPDGCHSCRPALNYYLLCAWPEDYRDDPQSRFVNERKHANIQKDGTYSVIPRIWGGVTSAQELRAIADVAEKFQVPCVKITGGQRIDLLGVPGEQLPDIWAELNQHGLVSGHAYGKALRTVKTCVGQEWCRFGTQDSTRMGIELEQMTWGSWTPHKFKMAVSGCPRNCAEATIKDFGVVAVESGWELHVGGNGGIKVRATDLLCKVGTAEEVKEYCGAFMQLYREEARYLERTAPWIERVGLDFVKRHIVEDAAGRKALYARFLQSQAPAQVDPWAELSKQREQFAPLHKLG